MKGRAPRICERPSHQRFSTSLVACSRLRLAAELSEHTDFGLCVLQGPDLFGLPEMWVCSVQAIKMQKGTESERLRRQRQTRNQNFQFESPSYPDDSALSQLETLLNP